MNYEGVPPNRWYDNAAARVTDQSHIGIGQLAAERDTGDIWLRITGGWMQVISGAATRVTTTGASGQAINRVIPLSAVSTRQRETLATGFQAFITTLRTTASEGNAVSVDVNAALVADVDAAVAAATGLVLMGYSCKESAGAAAAATFRVMHGATVAGGTEVVTQELAANGSDKTWFGPDGIACPNGISIDWIAGTVDVNLYYKVPADDPVKILINETNTALADAMLAVVPAAGVNLPYNYVRSSDLESVRTTIMPPGTKATIIDYIPTAKHTEVRFQGA